MGGAAKPPAEIVKDEFPFPARQLIILHVEGIHIAVIDLRDHIIHKGIHVHPLAHIGIGRGIAQVVGFDVAEHLFPAFVGAIAHHVGALGDVHVIHILHPLMLGHEEAVALFLEKIDPPVFPVQVEHHRPVGLV